MVPRASATIPVRVRPSADKVAARRTVADLEKTFRKSFAEFNAKLSVAGKLLRPMTATFRSLSRYMREAVQEAVKFEGESSKIGTSLKEIDAYQKSIKISIGKNVTESESFRSLADKIASAFARVDEFFASGTGKKWVDDVAKGLDGIARKFALMTKDVSEGASAWSFYGANGRVRAKELKELRSALSRAEKSGDAGRIAAEKLSLDRHMAERDKFIAGDTSLYREAAKGYLDSSGAPRPAPANVLAVEKKGEKSKTGKAGKTGKTAEEEEREYALKRFIDGNELDAKIARDHQKAKEEALKAHQGRIAQIMSDASSSAAAEYQRRIEDDQKYAEQQAEIQETSLDAARSMASDLAATTGSILANAIIHGQSASDVLEALAGSVISGFGAMLVQLGTAAVAAGGVGTVVPFLAPMTGGPAGIAAGLAAITAGGAMMAIGGAMGGGGRSDAAAPPSTATSSSGGSRGGGWVQGPITFGVQAGPATRIVNVHVSALAAGSPSELGRTIKGYVSAAEARGY